MRQVADEVRRARAGGHHVHACEGVDDAHLIPGEVFVDTQRPPILDVHACRVERSQHARFAAVCHLREKMQPRFAEIIVTHAGDLHGGNRRHPFRAVNPAQCDENFHRLLRGSAIFAVEHLLFFRSQFHFTPVLTTYQRECMRIRLALIGVNSLVSIHI